MTGSMRKGLSVVDLAADEPDLGEVRVVASAMSVKRSMGAEVSEHGYVVAVRFLKDAVRHWDAYTLGRRCVSVADVAHDRYLSNLPQSYRGQYPSPDDVAAAERALNF
ncbi:hypothetical protein [Mycobacterium riyadhense]|nr:hypothetical protein [Mycobacterium riyadhense]